MGQLHCEFVVFVTRKSTNKDENGILIRAVGGRYLCVEIYYES